VRNRKAQRVGKLKTITIMPLEGVYTCPEIGAKFTVLEADVATGQAKGVILVADVEINVNIHFHLENNVGPVTDFWFAGNNDDPNEYIGGAGIAKTPNYVLLNIAGAYPTQYHVLTFDGEFYREQGEEEEKAS